MKKEDVFNVHIVTFMGRIIEIMIVQAVTQQRDGLLNRPLFLILMILDTYWGYGVI